MSFSSDTKDCLCKIANNKLCCSKSELYGMLLFAKNFDEGSIMLLTENRLVAEVFSQLITNLTGSITDTEGSFSHKTNEKTQFTVKVPDSIDRVKIISMFGHIVGTPVKEINEDNFKCESCFSAFLRGVFLSCGSIMDPNSEYHLSFSSQSLDLIVSLSKKIEKLLGINVKPRIGKRKDKSVLYVKGSEQITDLLAYLGAHNAAMNLIQIKMLKEVRNYVNRTTNFETANIDKTVTASSVQIEAINYIKEKRGLSYLPHNLKELAELRIKNPEMSLRELGKALSTPISRSGVNHRLNKLIEISKNINKSG